MKKIKPLGYVALVLGLFFFSGLGLVNAFDTQSKCQPPLKTFSNGNNTFDISFPPGGGTNSDAMVKLPQGATVYSVKVDMASPDGEIGTPYIWVPLSATHGLVQIRTSDGSIVKKFSGGICNFSDPSRITVMPGGDTWVANRGNSSVTRLGLVDPAVSMEDYECKDNFIVGSGPRGVTFDTDGNIWVGDYYDNNIWKLSSSGVIFSKDIGYSTYGMIADTKGNIWISARSNNKVVRINKDNCDSTSCPVTVVSGGTFNLQKPPYGIGIDNDEDIWVGNWDGNSVDEIDNSSAEGKQDCASGFDGCCTGTAVDKSNNIWTSGHGSNKVFVIKEGDCSEVFSQNNVCDSPDYIFDNGRTMPHGIAIDFDNNAWVICRTGVVVKYGFQDNGDADKTNDFTELLRIDLNSAAGSGTGGGASYNYSDMTGLRTTPRSLTFGGTKTFLSGETFAICSGACPGDSAECTDLTVFLSTCTADAFGDCEAPLEIFSAMMGNYTFQNLEVIYGEEVPITVGGLVPCGREWDDPATTGWHEDDPCTFCHLVLMSQLIIEFLVKLAAIAAAFFLSVAGYYYIFAGGQPEKMALAKKIFSRALIGFLIILISWIAVDSTLVMFGYIDPLENDEWYVMCGGETPAPPVATYCGDSAVQSPNDDGFNEECDLTDNPCGSLVCEADCTCKTEPTPGVCGVWFSGIMAGNPDGGKPNSFMSPFELMWPTDLTTQMANWVANGNYPDNSLAFNEAVLNTFDGIAVDENTRLELWDDTDYKNKDGTTTPIIDITGPAIINNIHWFWIGGFYDAYYIDTNCFGLNETEIYWTDCRFSDLNGNGVYDDTKENMHTWGEGSVKITCVAP